MAIAGTILEKRSLYFLLMLILAMLYLSGCGGDGTRDESQIDASGTAAAAVKIRWHHSGTLQKPGEIAIKAALDCGASNVESIVCQVFDNAGNLLITGGPWGCTAGGGRVEDIPVGSDRTFVILARDESGNVRYHGQTPGIVITPNEVTENVVIDAYPFIPQLIAPENGAQIDPNTEDFEWEPFETADEYLVQVAENDNFETPAINEIVPENSYLPTTLSPSTTYFWRVNAFDRFGNMGAASDVWSLTTSDCTYTISSPGNDFGPEGGSGSFEVRSSRPNCEWSASAGESWIEITSGANGSDSGTVAYTIAANPLSAQRTGVIAVGGQQHTITQEGVACTYEISPTAESFASQGGSGTIRVTASAEDCPWSASAGQSWIQITSRADGSGSGTVGYTVAANTSSSQRTGAITVGGQRIAITQAALACTYEISPTSASFTSQGGTGTIRVTASAEDCSWSASAGQDWITITSGANGSGSGAVGYQVAAYAGTGSRTADISVAGRTCRVTQTEAADTTSPTVTITSPTSDPNYTTTSAALTIGGTAGDNVGVTGVTWSNSQGGGGTASGTDTWQAGDIALALGENVITVTARDAAGNTGTDTLRVTYETEAPDYAITAFSVNPISETAGSAVTVQYTVVNQGGAPDGCVNIAVFLSTDAAIDASDNRLDSRQLPDCNLAAGQSTTQSHQVTIPAGMAAGDYRVGMIVDVDNTQSESNESNNTAATPFTINEAVLMPCSTTTEAGQDTPETFNIEMGQNAGTFRFEYETYTQEDDIVISYEGTELWRTECVGASGSQSIDFSGDTSQIRVEVIPNCNGGSGTSWEFTVYCPE